MYWLKNDPVPIHFTNSYSFSLVFLNMFMLVKWLTLFFSNDFYMILKFSKTCVAFAINSQ